MAGNVWEWTRSLWGKDVEKPEFGYPYDPTDGRENREASDNVRRVLRGGAYFNTQRNARCACRLWDDPNRVSDICGFRVAVLPKASEL